MIDFKSDRSGIGIIGFEVIVQKRHFRSGGNIQQQLCAVRSRYTVSAHHNCHRFTEKAFRNINLLHFHVAHVNETVLHLDRQRLAAACNAISSVWNSVCNRKNFFQIIGTECRNLLHLQNGNVQFNILCLIHQIRCGIFCNMRNGISVECNHFIAVKGIHGNGQRGTVSKGNRFSLIKGAVQPHLCIGDVYRNIVINDIPLCIQRCIRWNIPHTR